MPKAINGSYKGHPTIELIPDVNTGDDEAKKPFRFGLKKAKLVLACINEIQAFVRRHEPLNLDPMGVDKQYEDKCAEAAGVR